MKHDWDRGTTTGTPDNPPEGYSYCCNCGVEETDDNRDSQCSPAAIAKAEDAVDEVMQGVVANILEEGIDTPLAKDFVRQAEERAKRRLKS